MESKSRIALPFSRISFRVATLLLVPTAVSTILAACSSGGEDPTTEPAPLAESAAPVSDSLPQVDEGAHPDETQLADSVGTLGDSLPQADEGAAPDESIGSQDDSVEKARNCQVSCGLTGTCSSAGGTIGGQGSTSFLGGCDKCYRRAVENANEKVNTPAFEGCVIDTCVKLGCD